MSAREAMDLRAPHVPVFDVNAVRAALAEEENRHGGSLALAAKKRQIRANYEAICANPEGAAVSRWARARLN